MPVATSELEMNCDPEHDCRGRPEYAEAAADLLRRVKRLEEPAQPALLEPHGSPGVPEAAGEREGRAVHAAARATRRRWCRLRRRAGLC